MAENKAEEQKNNHEQGLIVLIDFLNTFIDIGANRKKMIKDCKELLLDAYGELQQYFPVEFINRQLKVSNQRIIRLKVDGKCIRSSFNNCLRLYPTQLTLPEQIKIKALLEDDKYKSLPRSYIWADAQRNGLIVSLGTFYKYARKHLGRFITEKISAYQTTSVRATKSFEIIHMDSTLCKCENGERVWVHFIIDNYSRKVLGAVVSYSSKSPVVAENLQNVLYEYKLYNKAFEIYCDDGPENRGDVVELLNKENIRAVKVVANYSTKKSNNMIEAWNKKFKHIILKRFKAKSFEHLTEVIPKMLDYFNNLKQPVLGTLTPNEVINGMTAKRLRLNQKMKRAQRERLCFNREIKCYIDNAAKDCSQPSEQKD